MNKLTQITIWQFVVFQAGIFVATYIKTGDGHTDRVEFLLMTIWITLVAILIGTFKYDQTKPN